MGLLSEEIMKRHEYYRLKEQLECPCPCCGRRCYDRDELDRLNKRAHAYADQLRETYGDEWIEDIIDLYNLDEDLQ